LSPGNSIKIFIELKWAPETQIIFERSQKSSIFWVPTIDYFSLGKTKYTLRQMPDRWGHGLVCLCPSLANRRLQILGRPVLNSSEELQQLQLSKITNFVTPLFLDPAPASD
jgi:hypothetical protein